MKHAVVGTDEYSLGAIQIGRVEGGVTACVDAGRRRARIGYARIDDVAKQPRSRAKDASRE